MHNQSWRQRDHRRRLSTRLRRLVECVGADKREAERGDALQQALKLCLVLNGACEDCGPRVALKHHSLERAPEAIVEFTLDDEAI